MNNVILASYFNSVKDPQRGIKWSSDSIEPLLPLIKSCKSAGIQIIIFHDCFGFGNADFMEIDTPFPFAPNVYRWLCYYDFLWTNKFDNIFMVDSTDVEVLKNPFDAIAKYAADKIFSGSEFNMEVGNSWMKNTQAPLITIPDYADVIQHNSGNMLPNSGIVGGSYGVVMEYLKLRKYLHKEYTEGIFKSTDMAVHNYIIWKHFKKELIMGDIVNTRFKKYERNYLSWFKHK